MGYEAMFVKVYKSIKLIKWPIFVFKNPMKMKLAKIHCLYRYMRISIDTKNTSGFCIDTWESVSIQGTLLGFVSIQGTRSQYLYEITTVSILIK